MNGTPFKLGTFAKQGGGAFAAVVLGDDAIALAAAAAAARKGELSSTASIEGLLENWDANFSVLQEIVALPRKGRPAGRRKTREPARAAAGRSPRQNVLRRAEFSGARR